MSRWWICFVLEPRSRREDEVRDCCVCVKFGGGR